MKIKLNDKVLVIAGKDRGKVGRIIKMYHKRNQVVIEKVNMRTRHIKKTQQRAGEKIQYEAPISASNVMILDPKENKPTRIAYKRLENGKKERVSKLTGASLDNIAVGAKQKQKKDAKSETKSKKRTIKV